MCVYTLCTCLLHVKGQKERVLSPGIGITEDCELELELQKIVCYHVGTGDQSCVLWKSSKCS